jgi:uncharacterized linocin/CFP29 family protein
MADSNVQLHWTDEQWNKVRQVVYEEARKARVAGNFLPLYGPLEPDARYVSEEKIAYRRVQMGERRRRVVLVNDSTTLRLSTLEVKVYLRGAQVADPELTSALIAFRRAANLLARLEDEIVFNGQPGPSKGPQRGSESSGTDHEAEKHGTPDDKSEDQGDEDEGDETEDDKPWQVRGGQRTDGLLFAGRKNPSATAGRYAPASEGTEPGEALVRAVSAAIGDLEDKHHLGPFACVLDQVYFNVAQAPDKGSLVLPQDRILPFLGGGALLRTSVLPPETGLVIALSGAPIDLVVATDISVNFLQVTVDPWFVFRVYEKIVLRIKQPQAIAPISIPPVDGIGSSRVPPKTGTTTNPMSLTATRSTDLSAASSQPKDSDPPADDTSGKCSLRAVPEPSRSETKVPGGHSGLGLDLMTGG